MRKMALLIIYELRGCDSSTYMILSVNQKSKMNSLKSRYYESFDYRVKTEEKIA